MIVDILICLLGGLCAALMGFLMGRKTHDKTRGQKPDTEPAETPRPLAASESFKALQKIIKETTPNGDNAGPSADTDNAIREWLKNLKQ